MRGVIILYSNYTYEGDIMDNEPHGNGRFVFANGDIYTGSCRFGKLDGFGIYKFANGDKYTGFFSYGKFHGMGTLENRINISKGNWRIDLKHGVFYKTNKLNKRTHLQRWKNNRLIKDKIIQYVQPKALQTTKKNPNKNKKYQIAFKGDFKKCIGCYDNAINCANDRCGHVVMCVDCLSKCEQCPICRAPIYNIIKLFIS